jgi:membrane protease YdiL (CAAX protease family)
MELGRAARKPGPWTLGGIAALAVVLFAALFRFRHLGPLDFWKWMSLNILVLVSASLAADPHYTRRIRDDIRSGLPRKLILGVSSAVVLYALFAAGKAAAFKLFPFAPAAIAEIYRLKLGTGLLGISFLLGLIIGPGEEIFWRGFLQEKTGSLAGPDAGLWLTALLYAFVHVASGNVMLVLAAGVCGLFWGLTYRVFRSPLLNAVSHTVWALAVFIVFPL